MAFRKLLSGRIVVENSRYRTLSAQDSKACEEASSRDLRRALALLKPLETTGRVDIEAAIEAVASEMIIRGDYPQLKDSTGRVWT